MLVFLALYGGWSLWFVADPLLHAPLPLSPPGSLNRMVTVHRHDNYILTLEFAWSREVADLKVLVGGEVYQEGQWRTVKGVVVPIAWQLVDSDSGRTVWSGNESSRGSDGWSRDYLERRIAARILPAGSYRLRVQVGRDLPQFAPIKTTLSLSSPVRESLNPWTGVADYGLALFWFLCLPLSVGWGVVWLAGRRGPGRDAPPATK